MDLRKLFSGTMTTKLDIGCGIHKIPGTIGIDRVKTECTDIVHDISEGIPYPDNSVDVIYLNQVLEHIPNTLYLMEEVYRVLVPNGLVHIEVPHYTSTCAFMDITHYRYFSIHSMDYFTEENGYNFYSKARFKIVHKEFRVNQFRGIEKILNMRMGLSERMLRIIPLDTKIFWTLMKTCI